MKPTKTEYNGISYRSKSEAIFARCLDLACQKSARNCMSFEYEPKDKDQPPHDWDFLVCVHWGGFYTCIYIEYKPTYPTLTYVKNLREKTKLWFEEKSKDPRDYYMSCIVYGSPYTFNEMEEEAKTRDEDGEYVLGTLPLDDPRHPHHAFFGDGGYRIMFINGTHHPSCWNLNVIDWFGITREMAIDSMKYRFDLQHEACLRKIKKPSPEKVECLEQAKSPYLKEPGIYHVTISTVHEESFPNSKGDDSSGFEQPIAGGFSVTAEVLGGPHENKKFSLIFWGPKFEVVDDEKWNDWARKWNVCAIKNQRDFAIACDLVENKSEIIHDFCDLVTLDSLGKKTKVNLQDAVGAQVVVELYETEYEEEIVFCSRNIFHIDDPRVKSVAKNEKLISRIPAEYRHKPEYFDIPINEL